MASYDDFGRELLFMLRDPRLLERAVPDIEQVIRTSIEDNFRVGGRYGNDNPYGGGSQKWAPIESRQSQDPRILVDTADMINSLDVRVQVFDSQFVVTVSVRPHYGRFHQDGTSRMPARPFLVIQTEDFETIAEVIAHHLGRV